MTTSTFSGRIDAPGDSDRFSLTLHAGQTYKIGVAGSLILGLGDPQLAVRIGGRVVARDDDSGPGLDPFVQVSDVDEDPNHNGRIDPFETDTLEPSDDVPPLDTDVDGLPDSVEDDDGNGMVDPGETDPNDAYSDDDGIDAGQSVDLLGILDAGGAFRLQDHQDLVVGFLEILAGRGVEVHGVHASPQAAVARGGIFGGVDGDLGLLDGDHVHDHTALEHLGEAALDATGSRVGRGHGGSLRVECAPGRERWEGRKY